MFFLSNGVLEWLLSEKSLFDSAKCSDSQDIRDQATIRLLSQNLPVVKLSAVHENYHGDSIKYTVTDGQYEAFIFFQPDDPVPEKKLGLDFVIQLMCFSKISAVTMAKTYQRHEDFFVLSSEKSASNPHLLCIVVSVYQLIGKDTINKVILFQILKILK
jgi:hypothetical protein